MYRISKLTLAFMLGMQMLSIPVHAEEVQPETEVQVDEQLEENLDGTYSDDDETEIIGDPDPVEDDDGGETGPENPGGQEPDEGDPDILPGDPETTDPDEPEISDPDEPEPEIREADQVKRFAGSDRYSTGNMLLNELMEVSGTEQFDSIIIASGQQFPDALTGSYLAYSKEAPIILSPKGISSGVVDFVRTHVKDGGTVYILGGTNALSGDYETQLNGFTVTRLSGATRYETNLAILKEAEQESKTLLVTTGENFADGLSASAVKKPVMLISKKGLTNEQREYLKGSSFSSLYILGGTSAVSEAVEAELTALTETEAKRLSGDNRFATSAAIAREFFENARSSFVTDGMNFPDGLSISALAMYYHGPVLLGHTNYEQEAADFNREKGITTGYVAGGYGQFSDAAIRNIFALGEEDEIGGIVESGFYKTDDGNQYYWDANSKSVLKGRRWINGTEYVLDDNTGAMYDWKYISSASNWAFATGSGTRYKGWLYSFHNEYYAGADSYYLDGNGLRVYGKQAIDGSTYYFKYGSGARTSGWQRIEGEGNFYFDSASYKMVTGTQSIGGRTYTFDSKGRYIEFDKAAAVLNAVGWDLRAAYNWCVHNIRYVSITTDASLGIRYFANYGFDNRIGNCYVYAATLYEMAKMLGYVVTQMDGRVGNDWHKHSWLDVYKDGTHWVLDPDYEYELGKSGYFKTYSGGVGIKSYTAMKE